MMIKISAEAKKALELCREQVLAKNYSLTMEQANAVGIVYHSICEAQNIRVSKHLKLNCQQCVKTAVDIIYNYVTNYEPKKLEKVATIVEMGGVKPFEEMTRNELMELCKANPGIQIPRNASKAQLIQLLKGE